MDHGSPRVDKNDRRPLDSGASVTYSSGNTPATPLPQGDAHFGQVFYCADRTDFPATPRWGVPMSQLPIPYLKPALSAPDQVALLQSRGLTVADPARAAAVLGHLNYYRFSGYCLSFESARHQFIPGTTFEEVEALYEFDRVLRDFVAEAIEVVELDFRTAAASHIAHQYGAFGHTDPANFYRPAWHQGWLDRLRDEADRSNEQFITHYRTKYQGFPDVPVWMVAEIMSFGAASKMYSGMYRNDQIDIAKRYGQHSTVLRSWLHHLVYVRNVCAHHARLWGRTFPIMPELPRNIAAWQPPQLPVRDRLFVTLLIINALLGAVPVTRPFAAEWRARVEKHLDPLPPVPNALTHLGLTPQWMRHPVWR